LMCSLWCESQCAVDMRHLRICLSLDKVNTNVGLQIVGPIDIMGFFEPFSLKIVYDFNPYLINRT
jgi:hypothetical protein